MAQAANWAFTTDAWPTSGPRRLAADGEEAARLLYPLHGLGVSSGPADSAGRRPAAGFAPCLRHATSGDVGVRRHPNPVEPRLSSAARLHRGSDRDRSHGSANAASTKATSCASTATR